MQAGPTPAAQPVPTGVSVHLAAWGPRPFADVLLATPELAACFMLSPGWWSTAEKPAAIPDEPALAFALAAQLRGVVDLGSLPPLNVVVAATESANPAAIAHADTVLVLQPKADPPDAVAIARTAAPALVAAVRRAAAPDPRCDEPLLMIAEAVADAGSLTLAALPPGLRPVRDWLEAKDAAPPLEAFATVALDPESEWPDRRARLARMSQVGGSSPPLAAAAALVVEAFGDAPRARSSPFDLLLAWREGRGKGFPAMPLVLRRALKRPLDAGLPKAKEANQRTEVGWDVLARRIASGDIALSDVPAAAPLALRARTAAAFRAKGGPGLCPWLTSVSLPPARSGCGDNGAAIGFVFSRPREGGFEVVWRPSAGEESPLLLWPRWVLFPQVVAATDELWFVDPTGVWKLPLDAHTAPQLALGGSFRNLAVAPDGTALATARWPAGRAVVIGRGGAQELAVDGQGGLAFLDADVLVASDGEKLSLASLEGQVRRDVVALPCCRSLAAVRGVVTAAVSGPCEAGLVRVGLNERTATPIVKLADGAVGLVALPAGALVLGSADGLWSWSGQGDPERIGSGFTPGPG